MSFDTKTYPDTRDGALEALADLVDFEVDPDDFRAEADPWVEGVWKLERPGYWAIIYLPGYKDPMGEVRTALDFEDDVYEPEPDLAEYEGWA